MNWRGTFRMAERLAGCPCNGTGSNYVRGASPIIDWASTWEHWWEAQDWHLIVASLVLDGAPISELP